MKNYQKMSVAQDARVELHDSLALTGAEVSINHLPAGAGVPFVHSHKQNEEIYGILSGKGFITIDGEKIGSVLLRMENVRFLLPLTVLSVFFVFR